MSQDLRRAVCTALTVPLFSTGLLVSELSWRLGIKLLRKAPGGCLCSSSADFFWGKSFGLSHSNPPQRFLLRWLCTYLIQLPELHFSNTLKLAFLQIFLGYSFPVCVQKCSLLLWLGMFWNMTTESGLCLKFSGKLFSFSATLFGKSEK